MKRGYGWHRDFLDSRDIRYTLQSPQAVPNEVDMTPAFPPAYDQLSLGSCTGNGAAGCMAYARAQQGLQTFTPSRLLLYYGARQLEGTVPQDAGARIRDVVKGAAKWGACSEDVWPYDITKFADTPPQAVYDAAVKDCVIGYRYVPQDEDHVLACLAAGDPIIFGFTVYSGFESDEVAASGVLSLPESSETVVGGHCVVATGYHRSARQFIVRNSWGTGWGRNGYFLMPFDYLLHENLAADLWTIRLVTP